MMLSVACRSVILASELFVSYWSFQYFNTVVIFLVAYTMSTYYIIRPVTSIQQKSAIYDIVVCMIKNFLNLLVFLKSLLVTLFYIKIKMWKWWYLRRKAFVICSMLKYDLSYIYRLKIYICSFHSITKYGSWYLCMPQAMHDDWLKLILVFWLQVFRCLYSLP